MTDFETWLASDEYAEASYAWAVINDADPDEFDGTADCGDAFSEWQQERVDDAEIERADRERMEK